MPSPRLMRRFVSLVAWLVVAAVLIRIGAADGTFRDLGDPAPPGSVVMVIAGLALLVAALALVAGFATDAPWSRQLSWPAGLLAVPYGLALLAASHESGWFLALAALAALVASRERRPERPLHR